MSPQSEPDYYQILQVHPTADQDVIEAAYRSLAKKYHPDAVSSEQRDDPELQRMARAINEAYSVLSDPVKRDAYDLRMGFRKAGNGNPLLVSPEQENTVEKHRISGRCSKTRQEYQIVLARKKGSNDLFQVVGFLPVEGDADHSNESQSLLERLFRPRSESTVRPRFGVPSDAELEAMFDESNQLDFADIRWGSARCPICSGESQFSNKITSTWSLCGNCSQVMCMGGATLVNGETFVVCPSCHKRIRIREKVAPGSKNRKHPIRIKEASIKLEARPALEDGSRKELPD